jgi:hypothetical protein
MVSCRAKELSARCLLLIGVLVFAAAAMAQVAPATVFQLDGNAAQSPSAAIPPATTGFPAYGTCTYGGVSGQPCDTWDLLNGTGVSPFGIGTGSDAGNSVQRVYIDGTAVANVFTGGSKDTNDIPTWKWASHSSPPKDTFLAGYAAAYEEDNDLVMIFGANRESLNGDANVGAWFFQQSVGPRPDGTFGPGVHQNGDVFVFSAITNGGRTSTISVYTWAGSPGATGGADFACADVKSPTGTTTPGQCADANLEFVGSGTAASVCGGKPFCAVANPTTTHSTWNGNLASPLFFEGGVDVSYVFSQAGLTAPVCWASFLEETRASQSTAAELKDFLGSSFALCQLGPD